jgi:transcription elongation factor
MEDKSGGGGAPSFAVGDLVEVLSGKHAGRVGRVTGQGRAPGTVMLEVRRREWPWGYEPVRVADWQLNLVKEA